MKQATTVEDQINEIKSRGLILDIEEETVKSYFYIIGYYSLGFYLFPFEKTYPSLKNRTHVYKEGTLFSDVILLYELNTELRFIIQKYLGYFESYFKTLLIYKVSNRYKSNPTWFADGSIVKFNADNFNSIYCGLKRKHSAIINHHKNYRNVQYAPAWKTLEYLTFGQNQHLYKSLHSEKLKIEIAKSFQLKKHETFQNYLNNAVELRNICAHGGPLFDYKSKTPIAKIAAANVSAEYSETSLLYTIKHLAFSMKNINSIDEDITNMFLLDVKNLINHSKFARVRHFFIE